MSQEDYYWNSRQGADKDSIELFLGDKKVANFRVQRDALGRIIPNETGLFLTPNIDFSEVFDKVETVEGLDQQDITDLLGVKGNLKKAGVAPFYAYDDNKPDDTETESGICYDPAEIVLMAAAHYSGLNSERITAVDITAIAQGDQLLDPSLPQTLDEFLEGDIDISNELKDYLTKGMHLVERKGEFLYMANKYIFVLDVGQVIDPDEINMDLINAKILRGDYNWGLAVYEFDSIGQNRQGNCVFNVIFKKSVSDDSRQRDVVALNNLYRIFRDVVEGKDKHNYLSLASKLDTLTEKYPEGSIIDPVQYTLEFLEIIQG